LPHLERPRHRHLPRHYFRRHPRRHHRHSHHSRHCPRRSRWPMVRRRRSHLPWRSPSILAGCPLAFARSWNQRVSCQGGGRVGRVSGSGLAVRVVVLSVHSGAMRSAAGATLATAGTPALVHAAKLKKEMLTAYETRVSRIRARWNAARLCLRVVSRPQRGELTHLGRGCPVRRYYCAALAPKPLVSEGWDRCPRVRPEGRVSRVVPADRTSIATGFDPRNPPFH